MLVAIFSGGTKAKEMALAYEFINMRSHFS